MKNIHLLPTDKPSILGRFIDTNNLFLRVSNDIPRGENVNIYITSDEKIKEGDWYLDSLVHPLLINTPLKHSGIEHPYENGKIIIQSVTGTTSPIATSSKIILTTDQDLIKDGVQEIDDEFLEWFVNNPICEFVEIKWVKTPDGIFYHQDNVPYGCYKIITPKEESTFYTKKCKCMIFEPNCFTGMCKNCGGILKEETKPKTMLESLQEYFKNTPKEKVLEDWNESQHLDNEGITVNEFLENQKQETVKEAAEKFYPPKTTDLICSPKLVRDSFIAGAKWQQEQNKNLYSEEDLLKFGAFVRIEDRKEKRLFLIQDYFKKWKQI